MTNKSNKLERTSVKIDLDYVFTRNLAVLTIKLDAIALCLVPYRKAMQSVKMFI